ncbi:hypothetical protein BE11_22325 [Sorangium cellulosum]|nr:hypothetical protein BE11_22325 [Sorangium cellulosum]
MDIALREKIEGVFGTLVVDKRQALQAGFELMPRFVTEFLLATARSQNAALSVGEVRDRIRRFSVDADRKGEFISRLMREGQAKLIALLDVEPKPERNEHVARIAQLDGQDLQIPASLVEKFPELLYGGLWGSTALRYDTQGPKPRIFVEDFTPYQLTRPDMDLFRRARASFSFEEWLELLITSAGYRPEAFPTTRLRLIALSRLVPLVQANVNLIEMGPRGTGKSYLLRNLSARVYLLAGARATPAVLLYDLMRRRVGIVGTKKVVIFDEIGATAFPDKSLIASLKDYMESGNISRGGRSLVGDCSFLFTGNLDLDADGRSPSRAYTHLFEELPRDLCDTAIADRIHGFIPGWELPKISDDVLADGMGLVSDYFGEVLGELRGDVRFQDHVKQHVTLDGATIRDQTAIHRVAAGLLKMIYPDGRIEGAGRQEVLQVAVELRQRVHEQLVKMAPGEYRPKMIVFPGMRPHDAPDVTQAHLLMEQDVEANQRELVGKITILLVSERGGGDVGFVECAHVEGSGLSVTGLRGAVLEHSVRAAYDALLNLGPELGLSPERLRAKRMSVHLVNIAQPKDGPSAGLAFALAMLSAATGRRVAKALAVTGELSIHGNVNPVGGIPEKLSAALQHGRRTVMMPAANAPELARLQDIAARLDIRPVQSLAEAVRIALAG